MRMAELAKARSMQPCFYVPCVRFHDNNNNNNNNTIHCSWVWETCPRFLHGSDLAGNRTAYVLRKWPHELVVGTRLKVSECHRDTGLHSTGNSPATEPTRHITNNMQMHVRFYHSLVSFLQSCSRLVVPLPNSHHQLIHYLALPYLPVRLYITVA